MLSGFRAWEWAGLIFLTYTLICAFTLPGLRRSARIRSAAGSLAGVLVTAVSAWLTPTPPLHDWLLPPLVLLLGYWSSGLLFRAPMPRVESALCRFDRALGVAAAAASLPRAVAEGLEFAYAAVYALIPMALAIHVSVTSTPDPDRFWAVILVTDFICFGLLPWIQSRPPRALESGEPWHSSFRAFNLRVLGAASIRVNTCPSGHAAEALVAALLVVNAPAPLFAWMLFNALAVSAGAVLGRYHYAADALAGWIVAIGVWLIFRA
jgi:hypothetical protein